MTVDTSYLTTQVNNIVGQLHGIFDDIGIPNHEREARETELFSALSETLHNHLQIVSAEKNDMTEEAHRLIKTIKQMEASLDDPQNDGNNYVDDHELRISYPLNRCLGFLKEKYNMIHKVHRERFEQVKKLVQALESYSSHLEPSFISIPLPPTAPGASVPPTFDLSPSYVTALDNEFTKVYEEYTRRIAAVQAISDEIIKLWAELGTPQAQTDSNIVKHYRESPEQLGLHESDLTSLKGKRDKLADEKRSREKRVKDLKTAVEGLWDRLGVEERDRKGFLMANRGCGLRTINEFEDELARLNELKRQNLHLFVEDARCRLQELWDALYYSEEEMLDFTPAFSDVYSDALLEAHESEIVRLEALTEQRAPALQLIEKHRTLVTERDSLAASSQDASRLMARGNKGEKRDPGKLLREEKMRKRISKELPKVEAELRKMLERWEDDYGRPFLVHGERYLDEITVSSKPPVRSKTPSGPPPARSNSAKQQQPARPGSSMRGPPPPRSLTKTPTNNGPAKRYTGTGSVAAKSPSKIPSRVPLGNTHGNNSPSQRSQDSTYSSSTIRGKMASLRAPPPKMRDLASQPPYENDPTDFSRSMSVLSHASVRPMSPDDVYDDRNQRSFNSSILSYQPSSQLSFSSSTRDAGMYHQQPNSYAQQPQFQRSYPPPAPAPRQISNTSNTSTIVTATSGSENWETYDDVSEPEIDASEVYYAKVRAAQGKRFAAEDPYGESTSAGKKAKGFRGLSSDEMLEQEGHIRVHGSDGGWTDDNETY